MSRVHEEELKRLPEEEEQNQDEQVDPREGLGKIIDRERGPEDPLGKATLACAIFCSSASKKEKKWLLEKGVFIKDALKLTGILCQGCNQEVRRRKLVEGKIVIQGNYHALEKKWKVCCKDTKKNN